MRRRYSGRSDALVKSAEGEQGFWPSYADMMSAVALILFFLMLLSYIQNLITGNDLRNTQDVLAETRLALDETRINLADTEDTLALTLLYRMMPELIQSPPGARKSRTKRERGMITSETMLAVTIS